MRMKRSQHGDCVAGDVAKTCDKSYHILARFFLSLAPIFQGRRINKNDLLEEIRVAGFVNHLIKKDGLNFNNVKTLLLYPFISVFY